MLKAIALNPAPETMVRIPAGRFTMGSDRHYTEEAPARSTYVKSFLIDRAPVTNREFARFVDETGYVTLPEKSVNPDDYPGADPLLLVPSSVVFIKPKGRVAMNNHYNWWGYVPGASWRHPYGPDSSIIGLEDHPVVQVGYEDAEAYARWAGKHLPTEAEWEHAAQGGLQGKEYAWGDDFMPGGKPMANTWHGEFPWQNTLDDGYETTSPVGAFPPNGYGLYDMIGNVWEWTADLYDKPGKQKIGCCGGESMMAQTPRKVMKGGSFLCAPNYCRRYRPAARMAQPIDTATCHLGFRCVIRNI